MRTAGVLLGSLGLWTAGAVGTLAKLSIEARELPGFGADRTTVQACRAMWLLWPAVLVMTWGDKD